MAGNLDFNGYLHGIDFSTGEIFLKMEAITKECFPTAVFNGAPTIDQETGRMYMFDGIFLHCFQLEPR